MPTATNETELRALCPFCDSLTQSGRQDAKFYVNTATGLYYCFHCGIKGKDLADEILENLDVIDEIAKKSFDSSCLAKLMAEGPELKEFLVSRSLSNEVAAKRVYFNPPNQAIALPVFNFSGEIVGLKYRLINPDTNRRYISETGSVNEGYWIKGTDDTKLLILEGELDALTALQCGFKGNILACQTNIIQKSQLKAIRSHQNIFILPDSDLGGEQLKDSAMRLLGGLNPIFIELPKGIAKDLNEYLQRSSYEQCSQFIAENTRTSIEKATVGFFECTSEMVEFLSNKRNTKGTSIGFNALDRLLGGGIRDKELTIVSAGTGVGKTSFLNNIIHNLSKLNQKIGIISLEMDGPTELNPSIISIASKSDFLQFESKQDLEEAALIINQEYSYLNNIKYFREEGSKEWDDVEKWVNYAGPFDFLIIDHAGFLFKDITDASATRAVTERIRDFTRSKQTLKTILTAQQGRSGKDRSPIENVDGGLALVHPCQNFIYLKRGKDNPLKLEASIWKTRFRKGQAFGDPIFLFYNPETCELTE